MIIKTKQRKICNSNNFVEALLEMGLIQMVVGLALHIGIWETVMDLSRIKKHENNV